MNRRVILGFVVAGCLSITPIAFGQESTGLKVESSLELYQQALVQEQAVGDLPEAIQLYERAVESAGNNRTLAARALIRAAGAHEKLAEPEAAVLYAEVIGTYPEQTEWVTLAQARLEVLGQNEPAQGVLVGRLRTNVSAVLDPVLSNYCVACHNVQTRTAGLALDTANTGNVAEDPELWENVLRRLRSRTMPPAGMSRADESHQSVLSTLELALDGAYPSLSDGSRVTDVELASRIARFIWWGRVPDDELLEVASQGRLREPVVLEQQVRRMLEDPRALGLVTNFFEGWFSPLDGLETHEADPTLFPSFDDELRQAFRQETRLFVEHQIRQDRPAMELWTADYTFLNERLAEHYGISGVSGSQFRRVALPDSSRGGLLGQGSVLTVSSFPTRTSPTVRGKMILRNFFGQNPPDPPPNVQPMTEEDDGPLRTRLESHVSNPACASCHRMFDPLGIALENFDAVGQWRATEGGAPIDASGAFIDGTPFDSPSQFRAGLAQYGDAFLTHVTGSLLVHALGRETPGALPYPYEMPVVRAILREAASSDYRWASLILGVIKSAPFQMQEIIP